MCQGSFGTDLGLRRYPSTIGSLVYGKRGKPVLKLERPLGECIPFSQLRHPLVYFSKIRVDFTPMDKYLEVDGCFESDLGGE